MTRKLIAIIGGGPAGLMAAEKLAGAGHSVTLYDHKPSVARKFLMAGRGGLNLTHAEDLALFKQRYGAASAFLAPIIEQFPPAALRVWCEELGEPTFVGSSGRVFPKNFKASPLLRAWLARLEKLGVVFQLQHHWQGWDDANQLIFHNAKSETISIKPDVTLLALGGASWPRLGSDGGWVDSLSHYNIAISPLQPANCGFQITWSDIFRTRFAGQPLKSVVLSFADCTVRGDAMITEKGIEGGAIYALSVLLRDAIAKDGNATLRVDLRPDVALEALVQKLRARRTHHSFSTYLRKMGLSPVSIGLLMEQPERKEIPDYAPEKLAALIKAVPLQLMAPFPIDRAISTAGGISLDEIDNRFMLKKKSGVFVAGEMLDWEAPTGGYLLQACFATAVAAAKGMQEFLNI